IYVTRVSFQRHLRFFHALINLRTKKCPHFAGDKCKKTDGSAPNEPHPLWIVCGLLVVVCVCLLATLLIFFRRCRKSTEISIGTKVQYMNKTPFQGSCETAGKVVRRENEYEAVAII
ncbi:unnamed protein product, partial [Larinioides sclopetarius]